MRPGTAEQCTSAPVGVAKDALILIGEYNVEVICTVSDDDVNAAPARLACVVIVVRGDATGKLVVYLHAAYALTSLIDPLKVSELFVTPESEPHYTAKFAVYLHAVYTLTSFMYAPMSSPSLDPPTLRVVLYSVSVAELTFH